MASTRAKRRVSKRRLWTGRLLRRWPALVALGLVAFLYYKPLVKYLDARRDVARVSAEVRVLEREQARLERRLTVQTSERALVREARRLGYVAPGERLFIVKGIPEWKRARRAQASTIGGDG